jgi:hypothetical protein
LYPHKYHIQNYSSVFPYMAVQLVTSAKQIKQNTKMLLQYQQLHS